MVTFADLLSFVRQDNILQNWTDKDILAGVSKAIATGAITWVEKDNKLEALCFGEWLSKEEFYVHYLRGKGHVRTLVNYLREVYPNCKIVSGERKNRWKEQRKQFKVSL
jgi:hypothetical protein